MKRDWDCCRAILLALEELGDRSSRLMASQVPNYAEEVAAYHMQILAEAGLIEAVCRPGLPHMASRMTWEGHELLDKLRSASVWNKVKTEARDRGLSLTLDIVKALATKVAMSLI
jgi:hypothetical protein